jgi:hypothetical protein
VAVDVAAGRARAKAAQDSAHQLAEDDKVNMMDAAEKATAMMTRS